VSITSSPLAAQPSETDSDARGDLRPLVLGFELEIAELRRVSAQAC